MTAGNSMHVLTHSARRASYVGVVCLAFIRPDASYVAGSLNWGSTGIQFSSDAAVVKGAIATLKSRSPGVYGMLPPCQAAPPAYLLPLSTAAIQPPKAKATHSKHSSLPFGHRYQGPGLCWRGYLQ